MMINLDVAATAYYQSGSLLELSVKMLGLQKIGKDIYYGLIRPLHCN